MKRNDDGTFKLTDDAGTILSFNEKGNLTSIKSKDGKKVNIAREMNCFVVEDATSKRKLSYFLNKDNGVPVK